MAKIRELHPIKARVAHNGKAVVEVHIFGLTACQWKRMRARLEKHPNCYDTCISINGLCYFTNRAAAKRFADAATRHGYEVETAEGRYSRDYDVFVERVGPNNWR